MRLPPSPAILADRIDASTASLYTSLTSTLARSPLPTALTSLRSALSSVLAIQLLVLFVEAFGLRAQVLPFRYLGTTDPLPVVGSVALKGPDMFAVLRWEFWGPVGMWVGTSVVVPVVGGWVVNFRRGDGGGSGEVGGGEGGRGEGWRVDPLVFSLVKGLVAWVVYAQGGWGGESRAVVVEGVPGGVLGMMVGAGVGGVVSLWAGMGR